MNTKFVISMIGVISILGISHVFALTTYSQEHMMQATDRIVNFIQQNPTRYTANIMDTALNTLYTQTSNTDKKQVISNIHHYITAYFGCLEHNGQRVSTYLECEWIAEDTCTGNIGGMFNECASACRHLQVDICTLECIPVCSL